MTHARLFPISILAAALLLSCATPAPDTDRTIYQKERTGETPIRMSPNVKPEMLFPSYWIRRAPVPGRILMTPSQIEDWNTKARAVVLPGPSPAPHIVIDLARYKNGASAAAIRSETMTAAPADSWYTAAGPVSADDWNAIFDSMDLESLAATNEVRPAVCVRRSSLRVIPSDTFYTNDLNDWYDDMGQNSGILMNEPIAVLHASRDGRWLLVRTRFCAGWIHSDSVAFLSGFDELEAYAHPSNFVTVTCDRIKLDPNYFLPRFCSGLSLETPELFMGTTLQLADWNDDSAASAYWAGREPYFSYIVKIPLRGTDGFLDYEYASIPAPLAHPGYLPYTVSNIIGLAFQSLGNCYGWAGGFQSRDCSEYIMEIYRCFGFIIPRHSSAIALVPGRNQNISNMSTSQKRAVLDRLQPGSILYMSGHVMLYLGSDGGQYFAISAIGSFYPDNAKPGPDVSTTDTFSVIINDLSAVRGNGAIWLNSLRNVVTIQ